MAIDKLIPKVPDTYIPKNQEAQHWPACFGHINYLIDQINNNPLGGTTNSYVTTEQIVIPGDIINSLGTSLFTFNTEKMDNLIANGKYLVPVSLAVIVSLATAHTPTGTRYYFGVDDGFHGWNNMFAAGAYFSVGNTSYSTVQYRTASMDASYAATGTQNFQFNGLASLPLNAADAVKLIFEYKVIDLSWLTTP
jgi:hypothetical protein